MGQYFFQMCILLKSFNYFISLNQSWLTDLRCIFRLWLRLSTIYSEYMSFCGLAGSKSCCSLLSQSSRWKPSSRVGLVGRSVSMSHTRRDNTCAFVCGIWCCRSSNINYLVCKNKKLYTTYKQNTITEIVKTKVLLKCYIGNKTMISVFSFFFLFYFC